jgi:hypothetical protein
MKEQAPSGSSFDHVVYRKVVRSRSSRYSLASKHLIPVLGNLRAKVHPASPRT